jgi:hypothetical protein
MCDQEYENCDRYFLKFDGIPNSEKEVTKEQFIKAERGAGFRPKSGNPNDVATGGFGNGSISGEVRCAWMVDESGKYLPEFDINSTLSDNERSMAYNQKKAEWEKRTRIYKIVEDQ